MDHRAFLGLFDQLIRIPSVSSAHAELDQSNMGVINLLAERFEGQGFTCETLPVPGLHDKANLIATLGSGPGGLVLSGHTDTVPYDEDLWDSDPLVMTERDNRLYGLGSTDMKGFFAVVHEAVKPYRDADFKQPLIVLATADEESSMDGARHLAQLGRPKARYAVVGEPTGLTPIHMHKGIMMETLRVQGRSGHSSNPALGRNALDAMYEIIGELMAFRRELAERYRNTHFQIDVPTLNLGRIHGGDSPNRICGHCRLEFDIRLHPGMACDPLREEIRARVAGVAARHQVEITLTPLFPCVPPFANEEDDLARAAAKLTGHIPQAVAFTTEAPFLQELGMDTIVLGPGSIDLAHQPNEYLDLDQVEPCIGILRKLIEKYCL